MYIDEDASRNSFVVGLRKLNFDVVTTAKVENLGLADSEQLIWSTKHDRSIYPFLKGRVAQKIYMSEGKQHSGIIVVPRQRYSVGEQLMGLQKLIASKSL